MKAINVKDKKQNYLIAGLAAVAILGVLLAVFFGMRARSGASQNGDYITVTDANGQTVTDVNGNPVTAARETTGVGAAITDPYGNIIPTLADGSLSPTTPKGYVIPTLADGGYAPTQSDGEIDPAYTVPVTSAQSGVKEYPDTIDLGTPLGTVTRVHDNVFEGTFDPATMPDLITDATYENNGVTFTKGFYLKEWYGDYQVKQLIYYRFMDSVDEDGNAEGGYMPQGNFTPSESDAVVFLNPSSISHGNVELIDNDIFLHFQIEFVS